MTTVFLFAILVLLINVLFQVGADIINDLSKFCGSIACPEKNIIWEYDCCTRDGETGCCVVVHAGVIAAIVGVVGLALLLIVICCCVLGCCCCLTNPSLLQDNFQHSYTKDIRWIKQISPTVECRTNSKQIKRQSIQWCTI